MQKAQWQEHKLLCQAVSQLSNSESREFKDPACVSPLTPTEHAKVIDLIGKKCMVKCLLNDCEVDMFWDTWCPGIDYTSQVVSRTPRTYSHQNVIRAP